MEVTSAQKIARVLNVLVTITFVCNLLALLLVPALAWLRSGYAAFNAADMQPWAAATPADADCYYQVLAAFLEFCGGCTAVVLWQGRRVLNTVLRGEPFALENAVSLKRGGICAFLIAGAALARLIWSLFYYQSPAPLTSYNALFVPIFAMAGLLCLVMSALFQQAAQIKAENDLTI